MFIDVNKPLTSNLIPQIILSILDNIEILTIILTFKDICISLSFYPFFIHIWTVGPYVWSKVLDHLITIWLKQVWKLFLCSSESKVQFINIVNVIVPVVLWVCIGDGTS